MEISGKPMLSYVIERVEWAKHINYVVVATSTDSSDNPIVNFCKKNKIEYFRGDLKDVLSRYYLAAKKFQADVIIRLTADCPLIDGALIDQGLAVFNKSNVDYLSNTIERTFPRGLDFEIFTFEALKTIYKNAKDLPEREHVTPYVYRNHPDDFRIKNLKNKQDKSKYRITVDTKEDLELIRLLVEKFDAGNKNFNEIIKILDRNSKLSIINKNVKQKTYVE